MKKYFILFILMVFILSSASLVNAQCAMCTKTAQQMGVKPAQGLNSGILYLMIAPFVIVGFIGIRWWKNERSQQ